MQGRNFDVKPNSVLLPRGFVSVNPVALVERKMSIPNVSGFAKAGYEETM
jgi:hypothetical protein